MSLKKKLFTTISMFCLTIAMLMVGVWAVSSDQVSFGGTITFTATNILATISGEVSGTASDPTLQDLVYNSAGGPSSDALKTWSNNLAFKPAGTPFTIKITIQNDSNRKLYWDISDMAETNVTISKSLSTYSLNTVNEIAENGKAEFTITISLSSTDNTVTGAYAYNINLFDISEKPVDITNSNHAYLTFGEPDTANKTISVTGCDDGTVDAVIPTNVVKDGVSYKVTNISDGAFYFCRSLASITIPDSVTSISYYAFHTCTSLTSITIPASVTSIGAPAFAYCDNLAIIEVEDNNTIYSDGNGSNCIIEKSSNTLIAGCKNTKIPKGVTSIGDLSFEGCSGMTSVIIPDSVTSIGEEAFLECTTLASVTLGSQVTNIGSYAFSDCSSLASISLPDSVETIGDCAFRGCSSLSSVTIPKSVTSIGNYAFRNCSSLETIEVDDNNLTYNDGNGSNCIIEESSNTLILGCKNTKIPNTVTEIGKGAFGGCTGLVSISIPDGVTIIPDFAFDDCSSLTSIIIPANIISIGDGAFRDCSSLADVYYKGSQTQWNNEIIIDWDNDSLTNATIHYNYTGA